MADIGACFRKIGDIPTTLTLFYLIYKANDEGYVDASYADMAKALNRSRTMLYKYVIRLASLGAIELRSKQQVNNRLTASEQKRTYIYIPQIAYYKRVTNMEGNCAVNSKLTTSKQKINKDDLPRKTLEERKVEFHEALNPFVEKYGESLIEEFYNHWAQVNEGGTKMHWEKQKTFEIARRLATWKRLNYGKSISEQRMHTDGTVLHSEQMDYTKDTW